MRDTINGALRRIPVWLVYLLLALPLPWFFYLGATGGLGVEPIRALERELGAFALKLLVAVLAVTPLRRFAGINLICFRRAIGVMCFVYVLAHLSVWAVLDVQSLERVWADILKRPYITVGMAGFALLLPLALTSNNFSLRRLGPRWRSLHRLTYPAAILAAVHFLWLVKGLQFEPLIYMGVILALLATRIRAAPRRRTA